MSTQKPTTPTPSSDSHKSPQGERRHTNRQLIVKFLSMPWHRQIEVAKGAGLFEQSDFDLRSDVFNKTIFVRARERNLTESLLNQIEQHQP